MEIQCNLHSYEYDTVLVLPWDLTLIDLPININIHEQLTGKTNQQSLFHLEALLHFY